MRRYNIQPFTLAHLRLFLPQYVQERDYEFLTSLEAEPAHSFTVFRDGLVIGCAGIQPIWHGRAESWFIRADWADRLDFLWMNRQITAYLDKMQRLPEFRRIQCSVIVGFPKGDRWVKHMGFIAEGVMRGYDQEGNDHTLYARVVSWPQPLSSSPQPSSRQPQVPLLV